MKNLNRIITYFFAFLPFILNAQWQQTAGPEGGIVYCIERVGTQLWAGTEGGLYTSTDNGASWQLSNVVPQIDAIYSIYLAPNEIILGTSAYNYAETALEGFTLRSTDSGATWTRTPIPFLGWELSVQLYHRSGNRLYIEGEFYVYYSEDNGVNWVETAVNNDFYATDWAIQGANIVATGGYEFTKSTDGGTTWSAIDTLSNYTESIFLEGNLIIASSYNNFLQVSNDFGQTWTVVIVDKYVNASTITRAQDGNLYCKTNFLQKSTDNGLTWQTLTAATIYYTQINDFEIDGSEFIFALQYGMAKTIPNDTLWTPMNTGLKVSKIYDIEVDYHNWLYTSANFLLYRSKNQGASWEVVSTPQNGYPYEILLAGDTIIVEKSSTLLMSINSGISWTEINQSPFYTSGNIKLINNRLYMGDYGAIYSTDNFGITWDTIHVLASNGSNWDEVQDFLFINNVMYIILNGGDVLKSSDGGVNWTLLHTLFSPGAHNGNKLLYTNNKLYAIGRLETFVSQNLGTTWTELGNTGLPTDQWGSSIAINAIIAVDNLLYATVPFNGVFISINGGETWQAFNSGLGNIRGRNLAYADGNVYVGTSTGGVWRHGIQFSTVSGSVFNDSNSNQILDNNETMAPNIIVSAEPISTYTTTTQNGTFSLFVDDNDTIRVKPPSPYTTVTPPFYVVNQTANAVNFGIQFIPNIKDLCITATLLQALRPGFDNSLVLTVKNIGTTATQADVHFEVPSLISNLWEIPFATINGANMDWNLGVLQPFETVDISIQFNASTMLALGDYVNFKATVLPLDDENPLNNTDQIRELVVGSYDPNDKQVLPGDKVTPTALENGERLTYTIRFQNTGTFYAEFVTILDSLSANLDPTTIEVLSSSHPCTWSLKGAGIVEFKFVDMFLLPQIESELMSQGFVKFSIKPIKNLALGQKVDNTAYIFFDFNAPIITNTVSTTVSLSTNVANIKNDKNTLEIYPNPATELVWIKLPETVRPNTKSELRIMNAMGQVVYRNFDWVGPQLKLPALPSGLYSLEIENGGVIGAGKLMKM
jgi:uncharacterized repeat protein (TIGR01451 family)